MEGYERWATKGYYSWVIPINTLFSLNSLSRRISQQSTHCNMYTKNLNDRKVLREKLSSKMFSNDKFSSGGARSRNLRGAFEGQHAFGGGGKIEFHEISPPLVAKIFDPLDFFPYIFSEIFSRTFLIFSRPLKIVPAYQNFSRTYQFPDHTLCRCGSYTHGSQRLMVSTEIIKNWGAKWGGGAENNWGGGGAFAPPLPPPPPPWRRQWNLDSIMIYNEGAREKFSINMYNRSCFQLYFMFPAGTLWS